MHLATCLVEMPNEVRHGYSRRETAIGLCDPWKALEMDAKPLPKIESRPVQPKEEQKPRKKDGDRPPKEGSTHLPKFPAVQVPANDLGTKKIDFSQVKQLRREIARKYSANADSRVNDEYRRTKNDIYRMELDKLEDIHEVNRQHMRRTYFAYLQNNKGAKKAVYECFPKQQTQKETVKQN
ncbi:DgyrCDS8742 [Dimorphilus gyrociliatus]|uniref:DgyrCDS8742 n=1 Tax=Dimorphilus gyrociliatus TaxID=2664684 RepID=A0A7I8W076_9ANNE|nr:DgyrCDS8742 [Dimorphilus gyrociliatus]